MKKKLVFFLLATVLVTTSLFAQGKTEKSSEDVKYTDWGTYPIVEEPIDVDIMVCQNTCVEDFNTNEFTKFMEEKTGVHVNFIQVPKQASKEKLALTLASGDYPDAFLGFEVSNDLISTYGEQEGLLMPLNEYYNEEKMPNMMESSKQYSNFIGYMKSLDGNIYSLPLFNSALHSSNSIKLYAYQPFLDALNLPVPTTTDEFYDTLKAIKNDDPNGNGLNDEIAFAGAASGWNTRVSRFVFNSFLYCNLDTAISNNNETEVGYFLDGGKVDTSIDKPAYREALKYLNKLFQENLIYNGSFTQNNKQLTQLTESSEEPTMGFCTGGWRGTFSAVSGERFKNFHCIAPLEGPEGVQYASDVPQYPVIGALMISADSKYAEALVRYFDYFYTMEGMLNSRNGFKGVAWDTASEGQLGSNGKQATWQAYLPYNNKDPQNVTWVFELIGSMSYNLREGQSSIQVSSDSPEFYEASNNEKALHDNTMNLYKPYSHTELCVPPLKYTSDENEEFATVKTELANFIRQSADKFIVGTMDINDNKVWNKYLSNLDKLRMPDVLENMQTAYDRQYK